MENNISVIQQTGIIKCDFEGAKKRILERLDEYKGAVFTEDSKNIAKAERASLRKEKADFSDRIKDVKNTYMAPYNEFEKQAKELLALYDEPINLIDEQVKAFEEQQKAKKRELVESIYAEVPEEVMVYIPLDKIYNPKWENITTKEKDIRKELQDLSSSVVQAINTIEMMNSEVEEKALQMYRQNLSLPDAITYINNYERQKAEIIAKEEERKRQAESERIRREEREKIEAEQRAKAELESSHRKAEEEKAAAVEQARAEAEQEVIDSLIPSTEGGTSLFEYRMALTPDGKGKLEMYLDSVGIEWELLLSV